MFWYLGAQAILLIFLVGMEKKLRSITMRLNLSEIGVGDLENGGEI